jgi:alpha-beta hydrolase superfamily lysophospholipase
VSQTNTSVNQAPAEQVRTFQQSDGYLSHYRLWGAEQGDDVVVMLHGGMSHSGWQFPLGQAMTAAGVSFIATDRRGSGLNAERGHLPSEAQSIDDVEEFLRHLRGSYRRVHLAGWCFGAQVASAVAAQIAGQDLISSLLLLAPGFYFNERYSDVLSLSIDSALAVVEEFGLKPEPAHAYIQVPLQPSDFTDRPEWHEFITADDLRLSKVTRSTVDVWEEIAQRAEKDFAAIGDVPVLAVFGRKDRLVDNDRVRAFLNERKPVQVEELDTGHALHFEQLDMLTTLLTSFIATRR